MPVLLGHKGARAVLNCQRVPWRSFGLRQLTPTQIIPRHSRGYGVKQESLPANGVDVASLVLGQ